MVRSFRKAKSTQFDQQKHITKPSELLPGAFDISTGWRQLHGPAPQARYADRRPVGSRRERRRTPRVQRHRSRVKF